MFCFVFVFLQHEVFKHIGPNPTREACMVFSLISVGCCAPMQENTPKKSPRICNSSLIRWKTCFQKNLPFRHLAWHCIDLLSVPGVQLWVPNPNLNQKKQKTKCSGIHLVWRTQHHNISVLFRFRITFISNIFIWWFCKNPGLCSVTSCYFY